MTRQTQDRPGTIFSFGFGLQWRVEVLKFSVPQGVVVRTRCPRRPFTQTSSPPTPTTKMAAAADAKPLAIVLGMGNPLLDISASVKGPEDKILEKSVRLALFRSDPEPQTGGCPHPVDRSLAPTLVWLVLSFCVRDFFASARVSAVTGRVRALWIVLVLWCVPVSCFGPCRCHPP